METSIQNKEIKLSFNSFRSVVNNKLVEICGMGVDDLADFDLWNYFPEDEALTKKQWENLALEAAQDWLIEEGFPFDEDAFLDKEF